MVRSPRSGSGRGLRHVLVLLVVLSACTGSATTSPTATPVADPLLETARRDGTVVVIVQLAVPKGAAGSWSSTAIADAQRRLRRGLGSGTTVVERFGRKLPQIVLRVDEEGLAKLRESPLVVNISLNSTDEPTE